MSSIVKIFKQFMLCFQSTVSLGPITWSWMIMRYYLQLYTSSLYMYSSYSIPTVNSLVSLLSHTYCSWRSTCQHTMITHIVTWETYSISPIYGFIIWGYALTCLLLIVVFHSCGKYIVNIFSLSHSGSLPMLFESLHIQQLLLVVSWGLLLVVSWRLLLVVFPVI